MGLETRALQGFFVKIAIFAASNIYTVLEQVKKRNSRQVSSDGFIALTISDTAFCMPGQLAGFHLHATCSK